MGTRRRGRPQTVILLDAVEAAANAKGIGRVLTSLVPRLLARRPDTYRCVTTPEGAERLSLGADDAVIVKPTVDSLWEQFGLPYTALRLGASAVYTHREAGPLWGPPCLLHVPEDPAIRWSRTPAASGRERLRRGYSALVMKRSLARARVSTSAHAVWADLERRGLVSGTPLITPLGIDLDVFRPAPVERGRVLFHLGSHDPRDQLSTVLTAYTTLHAIDPTAELVVAGDLGEVQGSTLSGWASSHEAGRNLRVLGRISDAELVAAWNTCRVAVQPSTDEGFGLQPLEALACGAPLVAIGTPTVREVVGDAAVLAQTGSEAHVADAVTRLWGDDELRERLSGRGPQRAAAFSWEAAAAVIDQELMRLAGEHG